MPTNRAFLCNQCGAQLQVRSTTRFVKCQFCGCSLKVIEENGGIISEVIEKIKERQESSDKRIEILELKNQLLELDQSWDRAKDIYMIHPKDGKPYLPGEGSSASTAMGAIIAAIFLIVFISIASSMPGSFGGMFILFALVAGAVVVVNLVSANIKKNEYLAAKSRYEDRRRALQMRINNLQQD